MAVKGRLIRKFSNRYIYNLFKENLFNEKRFSLLRIINILGISGGLEYRSYTFKADKFHSENEESSMSRTAKSDLIPARENQ